MVSLISAMYINRKAIILVAPSKDRRETTFRGYCINPDNDVIGANTHFKGKILLLASDGYSTRVSGNPLVSLIISKGPRDYFTRGGVTHKRKHRGTRTGRNRTSTDKSKLDSSAKSGRGIA